MGRIAPRLLHWAWIPAPEVISDRLSGVNPGDDCLCVEYVLLVDDRPLAIFTNYLRSPEAARIDQVAFVDDFYSLLHHGGVAIDTFDIGIQAACADDYAAALLHVMPGEPVMRWSSRFAIVTARSSTMPSEPVAANSNCISTGSCASI
ncbi:UTRA domain-containing protein [Nocardia sp. NPDC059229]|uniref:UTRA domain-containing protein n=1 Tax=Nocardia sp. NPDC059229 TaxID=3346778 RepID=UPI0036CD54E7